jgi:hypothetical protein
MNKFPIITSIRFEEEAGEVRHLNFPGYSPCIFRHTFKEVGWDYIKAKDPAEAREYAHTVFISELEKAGKRGR